MRSSGRYAKLVPVELRGKPAVIAYRPVSGAGIAEALDRWVYNGLVFLTATAALIFVPFAADPFVLPKITLLYVGALLLGALGLGLYLLRPRRRRAPKLLLLSVPFFSYLHILCYSATSFINPRNCLTFSAP